MTSLRGAAVHCQTKQEATLLLTHLTTLGYTWASGAPLLRNLSWYMFKEMTVYYIYDCHVTFGQLRDNPEANGHRMIGLYSILDMRYAHIDPDEFYSAVLVGGGKS